jgi:UPF0716 protein FxsA
MARLAIGLALIVVPVLELALLIRIGQSIGVLATVALVLGTALAGALVISQQSFTVLRQTLEAASEGRPPVGPVLDGLFLMLAGGLLFMPGLITDALALPLLVPPIRRAVARWCVGQLIRSGRVHAEVYTGPAQEEGSPGRRPSGAGPIIEGEFERLGDTPGGPPPDDRRRLQ